MLKATVKFTNFEALISTSVYAMKYFISAGEASGDLHGAMLIEELRRLDRDASFTFLGGDAMSAATGQEPVIDYRRMAFMGFSEVLRNLRVIMGNFSRARKAIDSSRPDALILIDYPSFNLRLASYARRRGIPVYYFILPKVWAWTEFRVRKLRRCATRLLSILPFERDWFAMRRVRVDYVGNPSVEEMDRRISMAPDAVEFRRQHRLSSMPLLAIVPGSRHGEIRNNLPVMDAVARMHPDMQPVVAVAPGIDREFYESLTYLPLLEGATFDLMLHSDAALVTSGTATLECALAGTPQVACYRANGSRLSYNIMKHFIKCPFVTLPNLIVGREVIPEMLLHHCTPEEVDSRLRKIILDAPGRALQLEGYSRMRQLLGKNHAAATAAAIITSDLMSSKNEKQ